MDTKWTIIWFINLILVPVCSHIAARTDGIVNTLFCVLQGIVVFYLSYSYYKARYLETYTRGWEKGAAFHERTIKELEEENRQLREQLKNVYGS